jgi:hypothetical protein
MAIVLPMSTKDAPKEGVRAAIDSAAQVAITETSKPAQQSEGSSPFKHWYLNQFLDHVTALDANELLQTYLAASYGEMYEYQSC